MKYSIVLSAQSVSAASNLLVFVAPTDWRIKIECAHVSADGASSEQLPIGFWRATGTQTGGTDVTTAVHGLEAFPAAYPTGGKVWKMSTGGLTLDSAGPLIRYGAPMSTGWEYEDGCIEVPPKGTLVLRCDAAPGAPVTLSATVTFCLYT